MKFVRFEDDAIGGHKVSGPEPDNVAGRERRDRYRNDLAVAQCIGFNGDRVPESFRSPLGAMFLHDVEDQRQRDNCDDDDEAGKIAAYSRDRRCHQQHRDEWIEDALTKLVENRSALRGLDPVLPKYRQTSVCLGPRQPGRARIERREQRVGRHPPEIGSHGFGRLALVRH